MTASAPLSGAAQARETTNRVSQATTVATRAITTCRSFRSSIRPASNQPLYFRKLLITSSDRRQLEHGASRSAVTTITGSVGTNMIRPLWVGPSLSVKGTVIKRCEAARMYKFLSEAYPFQVRALSPHSWRRCATFPDCSKALIANRLIIRQSPCRQFCRHYDARLPRIETNPLDVNGAVFARAEANTHGPRGSEL
jgi:hypothetical protein